jgi:hypothetical protein
MMMKMTKTKIIIALVAAAAVALVAVGLASAQITNQTPNTTTGAPDNFWGYMGRCFQLWVNPIDQTTGVPINPTTPQQACTPSTPVPAGPSGYCLRGGCMARYW